MSESSSVSCEKSWDDLQTLVKELAKRPNVVVMESPRFASRGHALTKPEPPIVPETTSAPSLRGPDIRHGELFVILQLFVFGLDNVEPVGEDEVDAKVEEFLEFFGLVAAELADLGAGVPSP